MQTTINIAVVIPCYKVKAQITQVVARVLALGNVCQRIYVVDDCCPEQSGDVVAANFDDPRITILRHPQNQGVGGAVMTGYRQALLDGAEIVVKIDGDGQLDPALLPQFIAPLMAKTADYSKGNRFYEIENLEGMPAIRIFGNAVLSFFSKLSSGYWDIFDPTNGYTAIRREVLSKLPLAKISQRYFFESDMLFRLNILRAVVVDIPMQAKYEEEKSNLKIHKIIGEFLRKHLRNFSKRVFYNYFLRDVSLASLELITGSVLISFGLIFGGAHWMQSAEQGTTTPAGTVMLAALPVILGIQLILAFFSYDIANVPRRPRSLLT